MTAEVPGLDAQNTKSCEFDQIEPHCLMVDYFVPADITALGQMCAGPVGLSAG